MATLGLSEADRQAVEDFRRDVVDPSRTALVIVDFWAEWCGPCKQLTPVIEKVCAEYAAKGVKLVKVNVDEAGDVARAYGVSSIPDVRIFRDGEQQEHLVGGRDKAEYVAIVDRLRPAPAAAPAAPAAPAGETPAKP